jgi:hypothetical protein
MFSFLKKLFGFGSTPAPVAPYKVEAPEVAPAMVTDATESPVVAPVVADDEGRVDVVVPVAAAEVPVTAPAKKPRAKKPAAEKKPRAKKAPKA